MWIQRYVSTLSSVTYHEKRIVSALAGDIDGKMTMVLVFNAGDASDQEYLRKPLEIPDDDTFREAVRYYIT